MSLINDALKKAQKQRTGEADSTPAASGGDPGPRVVRRGKPAGPSALVLGGIGLGAVALIAVAAVFIMRRPASEPAPAKPAAVTQAPVTQTPAPKPAEVAPQPVVQAPVVTPPVQKPVQVVTVAPPKPEPVKLEPAPPKAEPPATVVTTTVVTPPVITVPPTTEPARAPAPGKLEPRAITYIESIRVAGIRASGSDRKVLMNDRVYRLGDLVEPEMGLTLVGIAFNALTFQDERGAKYTRNF